MNVLVKELTREVAACIPEAQRSRLSVYDSKAGDFAVEFDLNVSEQADWKAKVLAGV